MNRSKLLISIIVILVISTLGYALYSHFKNSQSIGETSGVILNNKAILPEDPYVQLYKLLDKGVVNTKEFSISPIPRSNKVRVVIQIPREENMQKFRQWLRDNNFHNIPEEKFVFE